MVEKPQGIAHLPAEAGVSDGVEGLGPVDEAQGPPERPGPVEDVVPASRRKDYPGHLKGAARACGLSCQAPAQVPGDGGQVGHDQLRLLKHFGVEALQDEPRCCWLGRGGWRGRHRHQEGVIDVAAAVFPDRGNGAPGDKLPGDGD